MESMSKEDFCKILAVKPYSAIGREITLKDGTVIKILDVSLGGRYILIEDEIKNETKWVDADHLGDGDEISIMDYSPRTGDEEIVSVMSMYDIIDSETKEIIDIAIENKELTKEILKQINKPNKIIDLDKDKVRRVTQKKN